jgi:hypothetical protein
MLSDPIFKMMTLDMSFKFLSLTVQAVGPLLGKAQCDQIGQFALIK